MKKKDTKEKKQPTPMEKLTQGYDELMKGKEVDPDGAEKFKETLKKAVKPRSSK